MSHAQARTTRAWLARLARIAHQLARVQLIVDTDEPRLAETTMHIDRAIQSVAARLQADTPRRPPTGATFNARRPEFK